MLNNFYLPHRDFAPLLNVVDEGDCFSVELLVEDRQNPQRPPVPLSHVLKQKPYEQVKPDVLKDVMQMVEFFPQLKRIVESQGEQRLTFSPVRFVEVLLKNLPVLRLFGTTISWPDGMEQFVRPQASLLVKKAHGNPSSGVAQQLAFGWQVALGDDLIPIDEFEKLVTNLAGIVKIRGRYVLVDEDELVALFQKFEEPPHLGGVEALQAMLAGKYRGVKTGLTAQAEALLRQFGQPAEAPLPRGLNARLRPYQRSGYEWLLRNARLGFGSLLADGPGLGKTLQAIAALLRFKEEGLLKKDKALVVVPAPLLTNWRREIEKFAPTLTAAVYHGQRRKLDVSDPDVIITTGGVASSEVDLLKKMSWYCVLVDEAQHIKNAASELTKSVKSIPAPVRIALIGMSVENRLDECWSILDFTNKGWLGPQKQFTDTFARPIQRDQDRRQAEVFRKIMAPFILRRLKSDRGIAADLPDKIEHHQYAMLTQEQADLYENLARLNLEQIFEENEESRRQELVLKMISELRQVCNHPYQFLKTGDLSAERSGKAALLCSLLENIYENGEKTLILTQSQETGELLSEMVSRHFSTAPLFLHEGTSRLQRDNMVAAFETEPDCNTLIISLKTGSASLHLTAAAYAIHFNGWWRPAMVTQATDRPNRMAPQQNMMAWRLLTQGTFEEKIDEMIRAKKDGANLTTAAVENWLVKLSNEDLKMLVELG